MAFRVWSGLDPSATAGLIESTHPDYYESLSWFLASAKKTCPAWITEVGRSLDVNLMLKRFQDVSQGDAESAFRSIEILRRLGVPIKRSTIRRIAEAFGKALHTCPLRSIHVGFPPFWDPTWWVFNDDLEKSLAGIDAASLARELSVASPREWRIYSNLTMFAVPAVANLERKIIDQIDPAVLAQTVARTAEGHEYELRCLLWALSRGTGPVRGEIARLLYDTVFRACHRSEQERFQLLQALYAVDPAHGNRLQEDLASCGHQRMSDDERKEAKLDKRDREQVRKDITRLKRQYTDAEKSGEDYVFEAWPREPEMDS